MGAGSRHRGAPLAAMIALALTSSSQAGAAADEPLAAYRWRSRVLVVSAPSPSDERLAKQRDILERQARGREDRDLVTLEAVGTGANARALRQRIGLPEGRFGAVLVGKDGGAKLVSEEPIPSAKLFGTIDAMPMRRDEMRRR